MAENDPVPKTDDAAANGDAQLLEQLQQLETRLQESDRLRQRIRITTWLGMLIVFVLVTIFVWRLYSHVRTEIYGQIVENHQEFLMGIAEQVQWQTAVRRESEAYSRMLQEEIIPDLSKRVYQEFMARQPQMQDDLLAMAERLQEHAETHARDELEAALVRSLNQMKGDLEKEFPEFVTDDWDKQLKEAQDLFIAELTDSLEERLARVEASLDGLKHAAEKVGRSEGAAELERLPREALETRLIDCMIDLTYYELRPEMGEVPARGGVR